MSSNPGGTIGGVPFEEHNMTDRLGEALAGLEGRDYLVPHDIEHAYGSWLEVVAAARNWHTLTRHTEPAYEAVGRWYLSHYGIDFPASDAHAMLDAAVDALMVMAEPDE